MKMIPVGKVEDVPMRTLAILLLQKGMDWDDLAFQIGYKPKSLQVELNRVGLGVLTRLKIEQALDCPIWQDLPTWLMRRHCVSRLGIDPYTADKDEMLQKLKALGDSRFLRGYTVAKLREELYKHLALHWRPEPHKQNEKAH